MLQDHKSNKKTNHLKGVSQFIFMIRGICFYEKRKSKLLITIDYYYRKAH